MSFLSDRLEQFSVKRGKGVNAENSMVPPVACGMLIVQTGRESQGEEMRRNYALKLAEFRLELRVDVEQSVQFTKRFQHHGLDFAFAVAEVWLKTRDDEFVISSAKHPGNFLEDLKDLNSRVKSPPSVGDLERLISCGGWSAWMERYWRRIAEDSATDADEKIYEKLIALSFLESREGYIAIYQYRGSSVFEVATRQHEEKDSVVVWERFNGDLLWKDVERLERSIALEIRRAVEA